MYIDTLIRPSHHLTWVKVLFIFMVLSVTVALLTWWQVLAILILAVVCLVWDTQKPRLTALSVKHPKELWQLGIDDELWQGYLNDIRYLDLGFICILQLHFYITEPFEGKYWVFIVRQNVDEPTFRQLTTLAKVGGYC